ncbi:uncharacterized protein VP01_1961g3 [Puccinia sorghi]|uniref:Uncharacterized protein n=1 Tax=Puccinia sorghi TaxID=27349 RepID=A0A0L6VDR3_9BASI|nr:uncharacterized protein VP01_1961g3 [Puccinia sorghi]
MVQPSPSATAVTNGWDDRKPSIVANGWNDHKPSIVSNGWDDVKPSTVPNGWHDKNSSTVPHGWDEGKPTKEPYTSTCELANNFTLQIDAVPGIAKQKMPKKDPELDLLQLPSQGGAVGLGYGTLEHSDRNAVLVTGDAEKLSPGKFPQRAVLGTILSQHARGFPKTIENPKLYLNVNSPFSALICGVQGSGKSHTASVILEGCLIVDKRVGTLPKPLAGLCLHYDSGSVNYPCEPAYLGMPATKAQLGVKSKASVPVTVLVS